jgi:hypothetical protein
MTKLKAPRIYHLPWSEVLNKDDKFIRSTDIFKDKEVIVTLKFDGENTSLYNDGTFHAKSLDSKAHESRDWLHTWWRERLYTSNYLLLHGRLPDLRLVGENMKGFHTIEYNNLEALFLLHSAWNGTTCLSWEETLNIAFILNIKTPLVLYKGVYNEAAIKELNSLEKYNDDLVGGYVIRNAGEFDYKDSINNVAKFVSSRFEIKGDHWSKGKITFNKTKYEV